MNSSVKRMNQEFLDEAREWFNNLEVNIRNQMVITMYKLCLTTKDISHNKLIESLNAQWNEKLSKQLDINKRLGLENEVLTKTQEAGVGTLASQIKDLELNLCNTMNSISLKITPSGNGKLGENFIDQLLSKIPNSEFKNRTQSRGDGDFLFITGDIKVMIESKNWTNSSIKGNPKELDNFRETAKTSHEENEIDFAIMALHRVTDLRGKALDIEMVFTKRGSLMLLYVTNLFNHPERILYAIDAGILLLNQQSKQSVDSDKLLFQIDNFLKGISSMEDSIKERNKQMRDMSSLIKKDSEQIEIIRQMLENLLNNSDQMPMKDRIIKLCSELVKQHGETKVSKVMLENKCIDNKIPARFVRDFGGIKIIKKLAIEKKEDSLDESLNESENSEDVQDIE